MMGLAPMKEKVPRLVIAGVSGDSGKTVVSLCLIQAMKDRGLTPSAFKKGPDYIDAAWHSHLAGIPCRNLDTFMVEQADVFRTFSINAARSDISIIEGNRGLYDGMNVAGTHSTAEMAKLLKSPVLVVINVTKATRTIAALIKGLHGFDPEVNIAGVILNKVGGKRHRRVVSDAIEEYCKIPVLGAIPKLGDDASIVPGRHLGLVTPAENVESDKLKDKLTEISRYLDLDRIIQIAHDAEELNIPADTESKTKKAKAKIGFFMDSVFTFYYPENLEALERDGAELVPVSSLEDSRLPDIDALYIGGGFPETQAERLYNNRSMMQSVRNKIEDGLPVYAECGGLIYLCRSITWKDSKYPMADIFPVELDLNIKPAGHGYVIAHVDRENPFFEVGTKIKGHEFHYSSFVSSIEEVESCIRLEKGSGIGDKRDGIISGNVMAAYVHIHADGVNQWAKSMVDAAAKYKERKNEANPENFRIAI